MLWMLIVRAVKISLFLRKIISAGSSLFFNYFIMTLLTIGFNQIICHGGSFDVINDKDSIFPVNKSDVLVGVPYLHCDGNIQYVQVLTFFMFLVFFFAAFAFFFVRGGNNTHHPRLLDIPFFKSSLLVVKCLLTLFIMLLPSSWSSLWVNILINITLCIIITKLSYDMLPCLGLQSANVNIFRTSGFAYALGIHVATLINFLFLCLYNETDNADDTVFVFSIISLIFIPLVTGILTRRIVFKKATQHQQDLLEAIEKSSLLNMGSDNNPDSKVGVNKGTGFISTRREKLVELNKESHNKEVDFGQGNQVENRVIIMIICLYIKIYIYKISYCTEKFN